MKQDHSKHECRSAQDLHGDVLVWIIKNAEVWRFFSTMDVRFGVLGQNDYCEDDRLSGVMQRLQRERKIRYRHSYRKWQRIA